MIRMHRRATIVAAATLLAALPAAAQPSLTIAPGRTVQGSLSADDPTAFDQGHFRAYVFRANAGDRFEATMESSEFDTYLRVGRSLGVVLDPIQEDDDAGGGTDSRLRFTASAAGTYVLVAQGFSNDDLGDFTLTLTPLPPPTTGQTVAIRIGQTVNGDLADTDNVEDVREVFWDDYSFQGRAGQRLSITMESEDFDTYLRLGRMGDGGFEELALDDDGADDESTNSLLRYTLREDGEYLVRATAFGEGTGPYRLTMSERPAISRQRTTLRSGEEVEGRLDEDDGALEEDGSYYEDWLYQGHAGEHLTSRMESTDFDTYLAIGQLRGGEFEEIASMDDGDDGTNSLLEIELPEAGEYVIRANTFGSGEMGDYTIRVESSRDR